jgi:hypothetical protein
MIKERVKKENREKNLDNKKNTKSKKKKIRKKNLQDQILVTESIPMTIKTSQAKKNTKGREY